MALLVFVAQHIDAQCPMCKIATESNLKSGGSAGRGLNAGILFLLLVPYSLVGGLAYYWFRVKRKQAS